MNSQKRSMSPIILTALLAVIVFGGLVYVLGKQGSYRSPGASISPASSVMKDETATFAQWKTYTNDEVGFSLKYPDSWPDLALEKSVASKEEISQGTRRGVYHSTTGKYDDQIGRYDYPNDIRLVLPSKDYFFYADPNPSNSKKVDVNWTKDQFVKEMSTHAFFVKRLSERSLLVASYSNVECTPELELYILTPMNEEYPNLSVSIRDRFADEPLLKTKGTDSCDLENIYQKIADKIEAGTYSHDIALKIRIAQTIADSVVLTK